MDSNVAELLSRAATQEPDKKILSEAATGRTVTCSGLEELVQRVVQGLDDAGMVAGYRVMIASGNRIEFVAAYLGALRAGMVVVPVNPRSATGELIRMLADSGTRMVIADGDTISTVRAAVGGLGEAMEAAGYEATTRPRIVTIGTTLSPGERSWDQLVATLGGPSPRRVDPETLAVLLYTSGTSGRPRAAMLSHRALLANIEQVAEVMPQMITGRDVVLGVLPLFHVYGLNAVLGQVLRQQARLVLVDGFDPEGSLDLIEDEAISVLPVAPPVFAYWMQLPGLEDRLGPGAAGAQRLRSARPGAHRRVHRADRGRRSTRGTASPRRRRSSPPRCAARTRRPGRWVPRCPGSRSGWSTSTAGSRTTRTAARSTSAATTCSPATGPTVPTGRTATAGGRPATSATSTPAATSTWSTGSRSW